MKKKKLERVKLSKEFLKDLLAPFHPMKEIVDIEVRDNDIIIDYRKEVQSDTS